MSANFVRWLIEQAAKGEWPKEDVGSIVWKMAADNQLIFANLDEATQKLAAVLDQEKTIEVAHLMNAHFVQWLIQQANEGEWPKEDVASIVCRNNADNQLVLSTLDEKTQKQVAVFNKTKTCSILPYMEDEGDFLLWLYKEAEKGEWDQKMVFAALAKEEVDGKAVIVARRRKGKTFWSYNLVITVMQ